MDLINIFNFYSVLKPTDNIKAFELLIHCIMQLFQYLIPLQFLPLVLSYPAAFDDLVNRAKKVYKDGDIACDTIPPGWAGVQKLSISNSVCSVGSGWRLKTPATGVASCNIPSGWTYSRVVIKYNTCWQNNNGPSYILLGPGEGVQACSVPEGGSWVYDKATSQWGTCQSGSYADVYTLRAPKEGMWSCQKPTNAPWTWNNWKSVKGVCSSRILSDSDQWQITQAKSGGRGCSIPPGFTSRFVTNSGLCDRYGGPYYTYK
ncbi:hypothetical protein TWF694_004409 [Orbilia ellipsospora]|uniref:Uncharacterized protein n=1 Tax=Orbilia ellipsospora TaxID=2528407 RepID=A0AAV9WV15_9PEZI